MPNATADYKLICRIQHDDFSLEQEYKLLLRADCGAVVLFTGLVREHVQADPADSLQALELEHYPGMTERAITAIAEQAATRFNVRAITVIHRVGLLSTGAQIVLVGVASAHRADAFSACELIMDFLKNQVPIWKKAHFHSQAQWVDAKATDQAAAARWVQENTP